MQLKESESAYLRLHKGYSIPAALVAGLSKELFVLFNLHPSHSAFPWDISDWGLWPLLCASVVGMDCGSPGILFDSASWAAQSLCKDIER